MKFIPTTIAGAYLIELNNVYDERGYFSRIYCATEFTRHSIFEQFVQGNESFNSKAGTLRGMHFQYPSKETKLVRCTTGSIFDVIIDLRSATISYRHWFGVELNAINNIMLYVPAWCAHGYLTLEDN